MLAKKLFFLFFSLDSSGTRHKYMLTTAQRWPIHCYYLYTIYFHERNLPGWPAWFTWPGAVAERTDTGLGTHYLQCIVWRG